MAAKTLQVALTVLVFCHLAKSQDSDCISDFVTPPEDLVARAGEMRLMMCEYEPSDGFERALNWQKGTTSILDNDSPCNCQVADNGYLEFNNVSAADAGEYECFVIVGHGVTKGCTATLRLAEAPDITSVMGPGSVQSTERVLSAHVSGDPTPGVEWQHNGNALSNSSRITITSHVEGNGRVERLTISNIEAEDRGRYTLHAVNTAGEDTANWDVLVLFGEVRITENGDGTELICTGEFYNDESDAMVSWLRNDEVVAAASETSTGGTFETTFRTTLPVPMSSCIGSSEVVQCKLSHDSVGGTTTTVKANAIICDNVVCTPPMVDAMVDGCSDLRVTLTGENGHYTIEYRPQGTSELSRLNITHTQSPIPFPIPNLLEGTTYDIRAACLASGASSAFVSVLTNSKPQPVTGVEVEDFTNSGGTFSRLTWKSSSASGVTGYHVMWEYNDVSQHSDLAGTVTQFEHVIMCDVKYKYRVAAINHCGRGEFSATVELLCETKTPPQLVELDPPSVRSRGSEWTLTLTFTIAQLDEVELVHVDLLEQDNDFVTLRTLNYTIERSLYEGGSVCLGGLTPDRQYQVCVRVVYSDMKVDFACSRLGAHSEGEEEEVEDTQGSCQLPTTVQKITDDNTSADSSGVPEWGIAVIVVSAILLVAVIFCFLGLCFACQTSLNKNANYGSSSSINTERGGNVVPTTLHMHNPRAMSPTRSCLKYHRDRGHSTTWNNDHVDTLRQMETSKGTHV